VTLSRSVGRSAFGRPYDIYTIYDALSDVREYDDACSIRRGLARLQRLAQDVKAQEGATKQAKDAADKSAVAADNAQVERNEANEAKANAQNYIVRLEAALQSADERFRFLDNELSKRKNDASASEARKQLKTTQEQFAQITRQLQDVSKQREQRLLQTQPQVQTPAPAQMPPTSVATPASAPASAPGNTKPAQK
jgi:uncharacterized phage infection (PIP) family protein YhgE